MFEECRAVFDLFSTSCKCVNQLGLRSDGGGEERLEDSEAGSRKERATTKRFGEQLRTRRNALRMRLLARS